MRNNHQSLSGPSLVQVQQRPGQDASVMTQAPSANPWPPPHSANVVPRPGPLRVSSRQDPLSQQLLPAQDINTAVLVSDEDFDDDGRPTKRRKVESPAALSSSSHDIPLQEDQSTFRFRRAAWPFPTSLLCQVSGSDAAGPSQLPSRPWKASEQTRPIEADYKPPNRVRKPVPVPNTPDSMDCPQIASRFLHGKVAGFLPWIGKHPEDVINDVVVKQGYSDRAPNPPEKELNTAKGALHNIFKNKAGLESLTALFSLVLDQKNKHNAISSTTSFKPPPRVTLTEAKRRSWISDLANPEVPLRRLSRTIPQGIRGQTLLEQCLVNSLPLSRAIWFAKCVGANEIRTLKRKGTTAAVTAGAESKWLREWTINVEQFIESAVSEYSRPTWKASVEYALRLATRFYMENLLDKDHYLDWIIRSFNKATMDHTPFWLMVVHIHKQDLLRFRKRGKRLADALVDKYNTLQGESGNASQPLLLKIVEAIRGIAIARPMSFLMPDKWPQCHVALSACLRSDVVIERRAIEFVRIVNQRTMGSNKHESLHEAQPQVEVIRILDSCQCPYDLSAIHLRLRNACTDGFLLMGTTLDWATTSFRFTTSRVYLAARLLRRWRRDGFDVDVALLNHLWASRSSTSTDTGALQHLIAELSRSKTFSVSKYLQWLTVRGLPRKGSLEDYKTKTVCDDQDCEHTILVQDCRDTAQLLTELSLLSTDDHVVNLRNAMLSKAGFSIERESDTVTVCRNIISCQLSIITTTTTVGNSISKISNMPLSSLSWNIRIQLAYWLRDQALTWSKRYVSSHVPFTVGSSVAALQFCLIRDALEQLGELAVLADVIRIMSVVSQEGLQACLTDTINRHIDVFSALGALEDSCRRVCQAYLSIRPIKASLTLFSTALLDLCRHVPIKLVPYKILQQDLVKGDRGRAVSACSPFSDGVAESLQQAGATFIEDFEAILQSEPTMNEQTMSRLFSVLTERIEKDQYGDGSEDTMFILYQLLARLRLCRQIQGDSLLGDWLTSRMATESTSLRCSSLRSLLAVRCITFKPLVGMLQQVKKDSPARSRVKRVLKNLLEPILCATETQVQSQYVVELVWARYAKHNPIEALDVLVDVGCKARLEIDKGVLLCGVAENLGKTSRALEKPTGEWLASVLDNLLGAWQSPQSSGPKMGSIVTTINSLSLPFCELRLRLLASSTTTDASFQDTLVQALSLDINNPSLASKIFAAAGSEVTGKVRAKAQQQFFESLPFFLQSKTPLQPVIPMEDDHSRTQESLSKTFSLCAGLPAGAQPESTAQLVEKLSVLHKYLQAISTTCLAAASSASVVPTSAAGPTSAPTSLAVSTHPASTNAQSIFGNSTEAWTFLSIVMKYLDFLLQMTCIQRSTLKMAASPAASQASKQQQQDTMRLSLVLTTIATQLLALSENVPDAHSQLRDRVLVAFTFNVVATLVDELTDEARAHCARILKDKIKDERVRWLFGSVNMMGSAQIPEIGQGLLMVKDGKGVVGEWRPKVWELLENGSGRDSDSSLGLGLFGARQG